MNCAEFENLARDLAREDPESAEGLAHAQTCPRCGALLEAERALTADLRALARASAAGAPPAIEARLLEVFHHQARQPARAGFRVNLQRGAFGAIAAIVLAACAVTLLRPRPDAPHPANRSVRSGPSAASVPQTAAAASQPAVVAPASRIRPARQGVRHAARASASRRPPRLAVSRTEPPVTEFVPFLYGDDLSRIERGQVVRVRLSPSALAPFGLPANMNPGRAGDRIKADVLLGEDGMARAIRFVY